MLTTRQLMIFKCIVEDFIETAEPVGSKTLMTKYKLPYSSATIRNEMSFLENYGYLVKTHTSSGRIPSKEGYRFYIDNLEHGDVDNAFKDQVTAIVSQHSHSLTQVIKECCEMLSDVTSLTTVALGTESNLDTLQRITIVPLTDQQITTIIVTSKGHVQNKIFNIDTQEYMDDVISCVNVMNEMLVGTPIDSVAFRLENDVKPLLSSRVRAHQELFNAFLESFVKFARTHMYLSGKENMLYQPEFNDVEKLRQLVTAFESANFFDNIGLMNDSEGVTIKIGNNLIANEIDDVAVVSANFKSGNNSKGSIAVIGPTRMPYEKVVSLVEYVSKSIEHLINEENEDENKKR